MKTRAPTTLADSYECAVAHANAGIGIEQTRQFVRDTTAAWGLPLLEKHPSPGETYADLRTGRFRSGQLAPIERKGSIVWASPILDWSKPDLNACRRASPGMPRNEVAALLHMSGECLCGAFSRPGELDEIGDWFPGVAAGIHALEQAALDAGIPSQRCRWGWGAGVEPRSRTGPLCSSCDARYQQIPLFGPPEAAA